MNNEIIISNISPQEIIIGDGGVTGITAVYVNGVDVTVGSVAYVVVPTKLSELENDEHFITQETDPTVPYYIKQITVSDINKWNNKQEALVSGVNIKTINTQSLLGSGNINIESSYTAGTGIEITDENVINNTITSYDDLDNLPTIPTSTSQLTNDSGYVTSDALSGVAFTGDYDDLTNTPDLSQFITRYVNDLVNYYSKDFMYGILPKVSGSGSVISLSNTYPSQLKLDLGATELSQDGTPTPSSPQDIHTISGSNTIKVEGTNLFNPNAVVDGYIDDTNGTLTVNTTSKSTNFIQIKPNTKYCIISAKSSGNWGAYYDENKNYLSALPYNSNISTGAIYTSPNNAKYFRFTVSHNNNNDNYANNVIISQSETITPYTPYVSQEADIDLDDIEYCKIGTYSDEFIREEDGTWQLKKNIGKVDITSSSYFSFDNSSYTNLNCIRISKQSDDINYGNTTENLSKRIIMNKHLFKVRPSGFDDASLINYIYVAGISVYMIGLPKTITTEEQALSYLGDDTMYYILATPTYTPITGTLAEQLEYVYKNMLSQEGQTNISQINNDLPFTISATTLKDLSNE
jgi:hypothetical protein